MNATEYLLTIKLACSSCYYHS